jgi:hypothetical protein
LLLKRQILQKVKQRVLLKKSSKIPLQHRIKNYYILSPMKTSESIEAHMSAAVAGISQRNQVTLSGFHKIFLFSVFYRLYRLAKASGFCLYFYPDFNYTTSTL